jgi:hypothetical protein
VLLCFLDGIAVSEVGDLHSHIVLHVHARFAESN